MQKLDVLLAARSMKNKVNKFTLAENYIFTMHENSKKRFGIGDMSLVQECILRATFTDCLADESSYEPEVKTSRATQLYFIEADFSLLY